MSIILEMDNPDELTSVEHAGDSFIILNPGVLDETTQPDDSAPDSEELQSDSSSYLSFLDIDLDDETDGEEIDTTESIDGVNQELEEVSSCMSSGNSEVTLR